MSRTTSAPVVVRLALHLRDRGPHTVSELAQALDVSRTSVEKSLGTLLDSDLVADAPAPAAKGAGRPARRFAFQADGGVVGGHGRCVRDDPGAGGARGGSRERRGGEREQ